MIEKKEEKAENVKLKGKDLIREALLAAINYYRQVEKFTLQERNKKVANMIGFTKIALKELETL